MGDHSNRKKKHRQEEDSPTSSTPSQSPSESSDSEIERHRRSRKRRRDERRRISSKVDKDRDRKRRDKKYRSKRKHGSSRSSGRKSRRRYSDSDESASDATGSEFDNPERSREDPKDVVIRILKEFPAVAGDLEQLLKMIDDGQAVDISGLSERLLVKRLRKLFLSLKLKQNGDLVFLLPSKACPTLERVGSIIHSHTQLQNQHLDSSALESNKQSKSPDADNHNANLSLPNEEADTYNANLSLPNEETSAPRKRMIGPAMPSAELLAAAAKLAEAQEEMREAELEEDSELFIGPPPPAVVTEAESTNEAERFEEITRIMGVEEDNAYDVLGVNRNMASENMKKRYWKLSLMVHPDKCSHPQAQQAFVKLNKAFKDLQDPDKRKALDGKIKLKEEQEEMKADLQAMREAAQWRRLQGISMEGDDILLAEVGVKAAPKRDEWMTTLPPERKPGGMPMHSTTFSKSSKEGRGDTSAWTDTPSDRALKAKMNYLEAYNEATALAHKEQDTIRENADAELVDQYNKAKRSKSLVEKHQEKGRSKSKKKAKQEVEKEEWEGSHPWKPWDREKDLTAGRQSVKLDAEHMSKGLTSRFSSGSFQRNFL
ncbi:uncharacterized protein LOC116000888 [Ipomoea triloba]|uniref:uncharacterized protein LOC116000888 n=1 Tax=Ipomoea triloba TaxID=35885 RepID=UPI00125E2D29|nr:uncharacterized protein LOC116000888 [Ipomoea triloba]XP_031096612.1 uncharacterized protein LOC116000888 [Ipomoea triloba]